MRRGWMLMLMASWAVVWGGGVVEDYVGRVER
jgi:hypothetical protein